MTDDQRKRVVYAKYILLSAQEVLGRNLPISPGIAVLALQDAAEMLLRVVVDGLGVAGNERFDALISNIEDKAGPLLHASALRNLNKARVGFKHSGNLPNRGDVEDFMRRVESFAIDSLRKFFDEDFDLVAISDLIDNLLVREHLAAAESYLNQGEDELCIERCDKGLECLLDRAHDDAGRLAYAFSRLDHELGFGRLQGARGDYEEKVGNAFQAIHEWSRELSDFSNLLIYGIRLPEYGHFLKVKDDVRATVMRRYRGEAAETNPESARFCLRFALETALAMQEAGPFRLNGQWRRFRVSKAVPILKEKSDGPTLENVGRMAFVGEILSCLDRGETGLLSVRAGEDRMGWIDRDSLVVDDTARP